MGLRGLAGKVGLTAGYLSQFERGAGSLPTEKMATFLRVASKLPSAEIKSLTGHWERRTGPSRLAAGEPDRRKSPEDKIGPIIKKMRLEKGEVLLGLGGRIGVTAGYLSKIER